MTTFSTLAGDLPADTPVIQILLPGEDMDPARRGDKEVLVQSSARFLCDSDEVFDACIDAIRASDEHLRNRPEELMLWDWQKTSGGKGGGSRMGWIDLGVAWYDLAFFLEKRDAWFGEEHLRLYATIGIPRDRITVQHWVLDTAVSRLTSGLVTV